MRRGWRLLDIDAAYFLNPTAMLYYNILCIIFYIILSYSSIYITSPLSLALEPASAALSPPASHAARRTAQFHTGRSARVCARVPFDKGAQALREANSRNVPQSFWGAYIYPLRQHLPVSCPSPPAPLHRASPPSPVGEWGSATARRQGQP